MSRAEDYLPLLRDEGGVSDGADTGVQIGKAVMTDQTAWVDADGDTQFPTLPHSTAFSATEYPILASVYPTLSTPVLADEPGALFSYRIVADLQEGA